MACSVGFVTLAGRQTNVLVKLRQDMTDYRWTLTPVTRINDENKCVIKN